MLVRSDDRPAEAGDPRGCPAGARHRPMPAAARPKPGTADCKRALRLHEVERPRSEGGKRLERGELVDYFRRRREICRTQFNPTAKGCRP